MGACTIEAADWAFATSTSAVAQLVPFTGGTQTNMLFKAAGRDVINKAGRTQLRLRFTAAQTATDYIWIDRGATATLRVTYTQRSTAIEMPATLHILTRAAADSRALRRVFTGGRLQWRRRRSPIPNTRSTRMQHSPQELEAKFWKALKSDRTLMLGLDGVEDGHARPMTAQFENDRSPLWFFTSTDSNLVANLGKGHRAIAAFVGKGHDLWASIRGNLVLDNDRAVIERLWNPFVAAWYEGKDDPKIALLRLDAETAEIWLDGSSLVAGVKMLLGVDLKEDYKDKVAEVDLR